MRCVKTGRPGHVANRSPSNGILVDLNPDSKNPKFAAAPQPSFYVGLFGLSDESSPAAMDHEAVNDIPRGVYLPLRKILADGSEPQVELLLHQLSKKTPAHEHVAESLVRICDNQLGMLLQPVLRSPINEIGVTPELLANQCAVQ